MAIREVAGGGPCHVLEFLDTVSPNIQVPRGVSHWLKDLDGAAVDRRSGSTSRNHTPNNKNIIVLLIIRVFFVVKRFSHTI
jgi:hypothetical protein